MSAEKLSLDELEAMLADPDVPDAAIRPYLRSVPDQSLAFDPVVLPDPETVDLRPLDQIRIQRLDFVGWANSWSRWRRQQRFRRRLASGEDRPVLVSEGDSWFQFPFLLDDTIDHLSKHYLVWSLDAAGDTIANMTGPGREYVEPLVDPDIGPRVRGLLFSAGGNDIIGSEPGPEGEHSVLERLLRPREPGRPLLAHFIEAELEKRLALIEAGYRQVLETVAALRPGVFVVGHVYAYAIPAFAGDPRRPSWARHGGWLKEPLTRRGFFDPLEQRAIIRALIDRLFDRLSRLMGGNCPGGSYAHGFLVDCRSVLKDIEDWADEIHPADQANRGFARVADQFDAVIKQALEGARA